MKAVVDEISGAGGDAAGFVTDVSDPAQIHKLVDDVVGQFGGIDILVNNAGVSVLGGATTDEATFEDGWRHTFAVNLDAHARLVRAALPYLQASGAGRIVNIASTEGVIATGGLAAYTASKHGVIGLTKSLAVELGRTGVTVNCICPGPIRTGMTAGIPEDAEGDLRAPQGAAPPLWRARGGRPRHAELRAAGLVVHERRRARGRRRHDDPTHVITCLRR